MDAIAPWRSTPWWTTKDDHWAKKYAMLVEHKRVHGNVDISTQDGELGKWCKAQRKYFNQTVCRVDLPELASVAYSPCSSRSISSMVIPFISASSASVRRIDSADSF